MLFQNKYCSHNLIELNIIQREYPVTMKMKSRINSQRGLYKIKDNFFKFYFRYIFPYISQLEVGDIDNLYEKTIEPTLHEFSSSTFEEVCIQYLINKNKAKKLPQAFTSIGRWWDKGEEIDKPIIAGECKWTNSKMGISHYKNLIKKLSFLSSDITQIDMYLFAKSGFEKSLIDISKSEPNLKLVELEDLF